MLGLFLIAAALLILLGDPSVKDEDGLKKLEKVASGSRDALKGLPKDVVKKLSKEQLKKLVASQSGAPKWHEDIIGWFFWNGGK